MPSPSQLKRGVTLAELLVASAIFLVAFAILVQFTQVAYRISHEEAERTSLQTTLILLNQKFSRDLAEASAAGLTLVSSGQDVLIHPVAISDTGSIVYQNQLQLWHFDSTRSELQRYQSELYTLRPFDGTPIRLEEAEVLTLPTSPDFRLSNKFQKITQFEFRGPPDVLLPFVGTPLTLEVTAELSLAKTKKVITTSRVFQLRNAGG